MNLHNLDLLETAGVVIAFLSFIVSVATVMVAIRALNRFAQQERLSAQLKVVNDLLQFLHGEYFTIEFSHFRTEDRQPSALGYTLTLFEIVNVVNSERLNVDQYNDSQVVFKSGSNKIVNIAPFINNPHMPIAIADSLANFNCIDYQGLRRNTIALNERLLVIDSKVLIEDLFNNRQSHKNNHYFECTAFAMQSWLNWGCCLLSDTDWCDEAGELPSYRWDANNLMKATNKKLLS